ncbi:MAG: hypothetical protein AAFW60_01565, partial [Pseudomonadota bacterium]
EVGACSRIGQTKPTSRNGVLAWWLANQPGLWVQTAVAGMASSTLITQGLRIDAALALGAQRDPASSQTYLTICLQAIEVARLEVEAQMRQRNSEE